jgi:chromosome segregation ATPase
MSSSFEFSDKAEEWLDVTPKEELLNNELTKVHHALEKRSMELLEANMTLDLFKGHKALLESQRSSLQAELGQTKDVVTMVQQKLQESVEREAALNKEFEETKTAAERHVQKLQESLTIREAELENSYNNIRNLNDHIQDMTTRYQNEKKESCGTIQSLSQLVAQLKNKVSSLEDAARTKQNTLEKSEQKLKDSLSMEAELHYDLLQERKTSAKYAKELAEAKSKIDSVSMLAEDLMMTKVSLEQSLAKQTQATILTKKQLEQSQARQVSLSSEISEVKASFGQQTDEMQASLNLSSLALEETRRRADLLQTTLDDSRKHNSSLVGERESLEQLLAREIAFSTELSEQKEMMLSEMKTREESMQEEIDSARGSVAREYVLREELAQQKAAFEHRLAAINGILGVTPMQEVKRVAGPAVHSFVSAAHMKDRLRRSLTSPSLSIPLLGRVKFI